jgi:predicted porin
MKMKRTTVARVCALVIGVSSIGLSGVAIAQSSTEEMKQQIDLLQKQIEKLTTRLDNVSAQLNAAQPTQSATPTASGSHEYIERKSGDGTTFLTRGGEVSIYGNLDISLDTTTKGIGDKIANDGGSPPGNGGWMPAVSTNLSYVGVRGSQSLGDYPANFVYQLETQIDVSATSGTNGSNSNTSNVVKGALTSRNSFIGLASPQWGAFKIGKTDAPYKTSTAPMNPFSGMLGDYSVIMGNSGGDNRVEFGTRVDHALWYESPNWGGLTINALAAPGQNRATDNSNLAAGQADCTGGNIPGSGGTPAACNDGSFGTAYSVSASYRAGGLYLTGAYEQHQAVNRTSDLPTWDPNDIADETAAKIGAQYRFSTGTTVSGIYESMKRSVPGYLDYQNERTRTGTWLAVSQTVTAKDSLHFGWAHANATPGDPGVHNTAGGANPDNSADMFTLAWKHQVDKQFSYYADYALTVNQADAHYDIGAGGRAVTTDCHDAANPDGSAFDPNGGGGHCYGGGRLQGVSVGLKYTF